MATPPRKKASARPTFCSRRESASRSATPSGSAARPPASHAPRFASIEEDQARKVAEPCQIGPAQNLFAGAKNAASSRLRRIEERVPGVVNDVVEARAQIGRQAFLARIGAVPELDPRRRRSRQQLLDARAFALGSVQIQRRIDDQQDRERAVLATRLEPLRDRQIAAHVLPAQAAAAGERPVADPQRLPRDSRRELVVDDDQRQVLHARQHGEDGIVEDQSAELRAELFERSRAL